MKTEILETVQKVREGGNTALADLSAQLSSLAQASRDQKILCILNSLDFETRQSRQSDIADTEEQTFEWIFHDHHGPLNRHVGFRKWLQSGNDIYWVSGKPGSGKSVLMNYIANEQCTQKLLQSWAGDSKLIVAKYFFWNAGAPMQKSQQGLLQSLLREIYGQCPELVPIACPSRWRRYYEIGATWTRLELSEAFRTLSHQRFLDLKFCIFVDGVDEYDGEDYTHIIEVLKNLNASPSVKICLSSRPWNIFISAFGADTRRRLLLEDHNGDDIQRYVENRFQMDEQFALLQSRDPQSSDLVDQIVRNAQGVFLWVRIVVSNLLRGLSNDDSLPDLHRRLQSFPTNLKAYFQHMFDSIDDFYREETAEILLICLEGIQPLSLLALWFYEQEKITSGYALRAERKSLSSADVIAVFESIHKRINARGQDLLVIEADTMNSGYQEHLMYTVRFSHRTVKDFLSKPDMLRKLTSWKSKDFDARAALCKATLAMIKSLPLKTGLDDDDLHTNRCWNLVSDFYSYAHLIEQDKGTLDDRLIDELERLISSFRRQRKQHSPLGRFVMYLIWTLDCWAGWVDENDRQPVRYASAEPLPGRYSGYDAAITSFFFALAVEASLMRYIENKLATMPYLMNRSFLQRPILDRALRPALSTWRQRRIDSGMIRTLLAHGANPNETLTVYQTLSGAVFRRTIYTSNKGWTTAWALFLQNLYEAKFHNIYKPPELVQHELEATKLMIQHGGAADLRPWRILALQSPSGDPILTPSDVFHEVFPPRDAAFLDQLLKKHHPWILRQACSWVRRTVLLWLYRDIDIVVWSLTSLYTIFFNQTLGVILPVVVIPALLYFLSLAWPFISFVISGTAPVLLPALILSDWIPILDGLIWLNGFFVWRNSSVVFNGSK